MGWLSCLWVDEMSTILLLCFCLTIRCFVVWHISYELCTLVFIIVLKLVLVIFVVGVMMFIFDVSMMMLSLLAVSTIVFVFLGDVGCLST